VGGGGRTSHTLQRSSNGEEKEKEKEKEKQQQQKQKQQRLQRD
jgi:hypothetical protein